MNIRPATADEVKTFYPVVGVPVRMVALEVEGDVLAVAGLAWCEDGVRAVSAMKSEARALPYAIIRGAHIVQAMAEEMSCEVYAEADPEAPNSERLLEHIGFEKREGGGYVYRSSNP